MSPESRSRLGMVRPERVADVCFEVHACFAEGEHPSSLAPLLHTVALITLQRFDRLPPHRQSLTVIASNIAGALRRLSSLDKRLEGLDAAWQFGVRSSGEAYDPHCIRQAVQLVTSLRPLEPRAFATGIAQYVASVELAKRGLPQTLAMLAYRVLQPPPWAAFLEAGGMHSALLWNMTALLGTFSPPAAAAVRFTVADCDRQQEALVRMLAAIAPTAVPTTLADSLPACGMSSLRFDRIVAIADAVSDDYIENCWQLLHQGGKALVAFPLLHLERWWSTQLRLALERDWIEALIQWKCGSGPAWIFVVLRTTASVHVRRRALIGTLEGELSLDRIEELTEALGRGTVTSSWLSWVPTENATVLLGESAPQHTDLASVLERYAQISLDFASLTVGNNGSLRFDDRITSAQMLQNAVRSAHSLRMHEMRYYYWLDQWWQRIRPLLMQYGRMVWQTVEQSLVEQLSIVPSMPISSVRALAAQWWLAIEPDLWGIEQHGARSIIEGIVSSIERKMRMHGVKLWKQLDTREEFFLTNCLPELSVRVHSELRRQAHLRQSELQQLDARIATLTAELATYRERMKQLHQQAKANDFSHDAPELIDSTMPLQNELSELLKQMVTAQNELKMLQQNRHLLHTPTPEDWFSPVVARCTAQLLPALQTVRRRLDETTSLSLLSTMWEDQLRTLADRQWESLVTEITAAFERCWREHNRIAHSSTASPVALAQ
ncbi:MAG: hypothetical protein N2663_09240 [Chlorobi bacterium]|nr:hypothetical protein [Chlorobiota bacterium]